MPRDEMRIMDQRARNYLVMWKTKTRFFLDEVTSCDLRLKEFESRSTLLFLPSLFAANISDPVQLFVINPSTWEQSR